MASFIFGTFWCTIVVVLITSVVSDVYYVTTNSSDNSNNNTLKHYLDNAKQYIKSDSRLIFFPGDYQLDADLVFEGIRNFTMTAINTCNIYCSPNVSIIVVNVTKFEWNNINLINCGKAHTDFINFKEENSNDITNSMRKYDYPNSSVLLYYCELVRISNVYISVNVHSAGILAMNVKKSLIIDSVKVQLNCSGNHNFNYPIHGIILYYRNKGGKSKANVKINKLNYKVNGLCTHLSRYAVKVLLFQNKYIVFLLPLKIQIFKILTTAAYYIMLCCYANQKQLILYSNYRILQFPIILGILLMQCFIYNFLNHHVQILFILKMGLPNILITSLS